MVKSPARRRGRQDIGRLSPIATGTNAGLDGFTGYRIPKRLVGTVGRYGDRVPSRLSPIFLDREELESASSLPTRIKAALEDSLALIVVCSPQAVESKWVDQEIRVFKSAGREERVFAGIVNGDRAGYETVRDSKPCFPEALRYEIDSERRLTDARVEPLAGRRR